MSDRDLESEALWAGREPVPPHLAPGTSGETPVALPPSPWPIRRKWIGRALAGLLLLFLVALAWLAVTAPLSKSLEPLAPPKLTLLAADGTPIARNGAVIEQPVKVAKLPKHVTNAFLAIEDRRFYSHWGVDPRGLARAALNNLGSGPTQGGSTITQQLAKITFLDYDRTMTRKARELLIAFWLEAWLSKDEILERYLSNVYFGDNVYGLRAASLHYFYRQPERLTLPQAAMLAGLVKAPSRLAPTRNPEAARKRARLVLMAMADAGMLSRGEAQSVKLPSLDVRARETLPTGTYFADWAMAEARDATETGYGEHKVKTTLDPRLQQIAARVATGAPLGKAQVALVAMRTNGEVVAMVGGRSYRASRFNRATQARRQPGSTFKLFVYLAALRSGMSPESIVNDTPIETGPYRPRNSGDRYLGRISLERAFARSSNVVSIRLYQQLGARPIVRAARDLGVRSPLSEDPTLALGTSEITLLELTSAFAAIAADSYPVKPHAIRKEQPGWFGRLFTPERSLGGRVHDDMLTLLSGVIENGTGRGARLSIPAYGKTGTSQDSRDALFVGFAGDLVVGVWVGNDDNQPLKGMSGGGLPARIWRDFMRQAIKGAAPPAPRPAPRPEQPGLPDIPVPEDLMPADGLPVRIGNSQVQIGADESITLKTKLGDVPVNLRLDRDGLSVDAPQKADQNPGP